LKGLKKKKVNGHRGFAACSNFAIELKIQSREQAAAQQRASSLHSSCTVLAVGKIGTPKEILDTPKENPITPKVTTRRIEELKSNQGGKW